MHQTSKKEKWNYRKQNVIKFRNWQSWIVELNSWRIEDSDAWLWLDLPTRYPLFLPPKGLARFGTTSSTVVSNESWIDVERPMAPYHLRLLLVLDQVVVQSLSSYSSSKENSLKPKVLAEVSIEVWSLQANVTSVESNWASLSWASHLRDILLGVAPSPWVQVGWRRNLVEKLYGKNPAMELKTSQGNGMG